MEMESVEEFYYHTFVVWGRGIAWGSLIFSAHWLVVFGVLVKVTYAE